MASGAYRSLTIELNATTSGLDAALRKSSTEANKLERELKEAQRAAKLDGAGADTFARQMDLMAHRIDAAKDKLKKLQAIAAKNGQVVDGKEQRLSADAWSKLNFEVEKTNAEIQKYTAMMRELAVAQGSADSAIGKTGERLVRLGEELGPVSEKMQKVGRAATKYVSVPILGAATASVKAATDIDSALTGVRKTVDGTEEDYQALKDAAIEFSKTNGVSATEVLNIQALGAQLGFSVDELDEFSRVVAGLDLSTNLDAETAATSLAQFANVMGMGHDEVSNFASALIDLGNHFSTTEADVMDMAMRISGAGKSIGLTEADVLGLATALSSVGIEAEAGGTAISTILSGIDKDVALGSENLERWAQVAGMSADEFADAWRDDALGAFQDVVAGMQDGGENVSVLLEELGVSSIRQTDAMKRLVNASELLPNAIETANAAYEENSALSAEVANFNGSLAAKFEMLKNRVTAVASEVGEPLADALMEALDAAEPLFHAIEEGAEAFAAMDEEEQRAMISAGAAVAALGPLLTVAGKMVGSVGSAGGALKALATATEGLAAGAGAAEGAASKLIGAGAKAGLYGIAAAAAVAAAALAVKAYKDYKKRVEDATLATEGLIDAESVGMSRAGKVAEGSLESLQWTLKDTRDSIEEVADMVRGWQDAWQELGTESNTLDYYLGVIDDLGGKASLTKDEQWKLNDAIEHYNEITGDDLSLVDGKLSKDREAIRKTADEWYNLAAAQQYASQVEELVAKRSELTDQKNAAYQAMADANKALEEAYADTSLSLMPPEAYSAYIGQLERDAASATKAYEELATEVGAVDSSIEELGKRASSTDQAMLSSVLGNSELTYGLDEAGVSAAEFAEYLSLIGANSERIASVSGAGVDALVDGYGRMADAAKAAGISTGDFAAGLKQAGVTTEDLSTVGADQLAQWYREADGDFAAVKQRIDEFNATEMDKKVVEVTDRGTSRDTQRKLDSIDTSNETKTVTVAVNDLATGKLADIKSRLSELQGTVTTTVRAAMSKNAAGGIAVPRHADGGIMTRATLTDVGIVGEDGWEAIVPLSNARYVRPFARAVAREMGGGGDTTVYNVSINGATINDNAAMRDATKSFLVEMMRTANI